MKSTWFSVLLAAWACLVAGPAAAAPIVMKISTPMAADSTNDWMKAVKQRVEQRAGGRIRVDLFSSSQLGQPAAAVEGVAMGTIEIAIAPIGFVGLEPRLQQLDAAGLFDDTEHARRVLQDPEVRKLLSGMGASKGIEPLFVNATSPLYLLSHRPILGLAELSGLKVRAPGGSPLYLQPLRAFGATPVVLSLSEMMPAMQNRTIDGMIAGLPIFTAFKYYDIAPHLTEVPRSFMLAVGLVNRAFMKSLGPELERIVREASAEAEAVMAARNAEQLAQMRKAWADHGGHVYSLPVADQGRYSSQVELALKPLLTENPRMKQDHAVLTAASARQRRH